MKINTKKKNTPKIDSSSISLEDFEKMRKKYYKFTGENKRKQAKCLVKLISPDGKEVECGKIYNNVSTDTCNKHLCKHVTLEEFTGKKLLQGNLNNFIKQFSSVEKELKTLLLSLIVNNNLSWATLDSQEWKDIMSLHMHHDYFGEGGEAEFSLCPLNSVYVSEFSIIFSET